MKEIPLTNQRGIILVDDDDYERLQVYNWQIVGKGYAAFWDGTRYHRIHRVIMSPPEGYLVDHINHNKLDNRKQNLRVCTLAENQHNSVLRSDNPSGYKGVSYRKKRNGWGTHIRARGTQVWLGTFPNKEDAAIAYDMAALMYFGDFANTNLLLPLQ